MFWFWGGGDDTFIALPRKYVIGPVFIVNNLK